MRIGVNERDIVLPWGPLSKTESPRNMKERNSKSKKRITEIVENKLEIKLDTTIKIKI